jgi:molybdopterin/thiamine biosynthesis adenylyltransferase
MTLTDPNTPDVTIDHSMHTALFDPAQHVWDVHVIGCGGIGSQLALQLAQLGVAHIHFYDDDVVQEHNLAYQHFRVADIGMFKAEALCRRLAEYGYHNTTAHVGRVDTNTPPFSGVVISGVDSMASRQAIWDRVKWKPEVFAYIDLRIGGEHLEMLTINPMDVEQHDLYEQTLCSDDNVAPLPCAARAIVHPAVQVSTLAVFQLVNFSRDPDNLRWRVQSFGPAFELYAF